MSNTQHPTPSNTRSIGPARMNIARVHVLTEDVSSTVRTPPGLPRGGGYVPPTMTSGGGGTSALPTLTRASPPCRTPSCEARWAPALPSRRLPGSAAHATPSCRCRDLDHAALLRLPPSCRRPTSEGKTGGGGGTRAGAIAMSSHGADVTSRVAWASRATRPSPDARPPHGGPV